MMNKESLLARKKDLEAGTAGLQTFIANCRHTIGQAEANIHANAGAIQLIDALIAEISADNVVQITEAASVNEG